MKPPRITLSAWTAPSTNTVQMGYFRRQRKRERAREREYIAELGQMISVFDAEEKKTSDQTPDSSAWIC